MTEKANPFPAYPVARLKDDVREVGRRTIVTEAVRESRARVSAYTDAWKARASDRELDVGPVVVRIQGDYGTGKTHLLLDAAARVEEELTPLFPNATVIKVACLDTDPVEWFRQGFGPELRRPFLKESVVRLYALAGEHVAQSAPLTSGAAAKLSEDPGLIYKLIKDDLLNITAVEDRFRALLAEITPEAGEEIRRALAGLVWEPTERTAWKWLAGEEIPATDAERLGLPGQLSSQSDVSAVLLAVAAIQNRVANPFGVLIDELEHLAGRDAAGGGKGNITWLKRLVEGLAKYRALVYVSGHDSAWGPYSDLFDRFSQYKPITLRKWTASDVLKLVNTRVPDAPPENFDAAEAEIVASLTGGNIRRVMSMCLALFRDSSGFSRPVREADLRRVAEQIGQSISIGEATAHIRQIAEGLGLHVLSESFLETKEPGTTKVRFDLVGLRANQPRLVVDLKHAQDQRSMSSLAQRFVAKVGEATVSYPEVLGCFVVDGNVDDEALAVLRSDSRLRILSFDLTQRDPINLITRELTEKLSGGGDISPEATRLKELHEQEEDIAERMKAARREEDAGLVRRLEQEREALRGQVDELRSQLGASSRRLEDELSAIEQRRKAELEELYARLEQLSKQTATQREAEIVAPQLEEVTARLQTTYADLTKPLPLSTKLRLTLSNLLAGIGLAYLIGGIVLFFLINTIAEYRHPDSRYEDYLSQRTSLRIFLIVLSLSLAVSGAFILWRRFMQIEAYFDYATRLLREVYLQSPDPMELVKVNNILRDSLEDSGPKFGKRQANQRLAKELPEYFLYLGERAAAEEAHTRAATS